MPSTLSFPTKALMTKSLSPVSEHERREGRAGLTLILGCSPRAGTELGTPQMPQTDRISAPPRGSCLALLGGTASDLAHD